MKKTIGCKIFLKKVVYLEKAFKFREKRKLGLIENDVFSKNMQCQHQNKIKVDTQIYQKQTSVENKLCSPVFRFNVSFKNRKSWTFSYLTSLILLLCFKKPVAIN